MTDKCENGKPKDCRYCYYYGRHGCMLKVCCASRSAAFHPQAVRGHFGNPALASR